MSDIPLAPMILASITDQTPNGSVVLKLETRLTQLQIGEIDQTHQIVGLMQETMKEVLENVRG